MNAGATVRDEVHDKVHDTAKATVQARAANECVLNHPALAAEAIEKLPIEDQLEELEHLAPPALVLLLDYLSPAQAGAIFEQLTEARQRAVLEQAPGRLAVLLLAQLEEDRRAEVMAGLGKSLRADLERQLSFPTDSAGRLMDNVFVSCRVTMTVEEALRTLRLSRVRRARSVHAVDAANRLVGRVDVQDLALEEPTTPLRGIMQPVQVALTPMDPREHIVQQLDEHRLDALPVVDSEQRLMGVVRYDSLYTAIEDVATADIQKMVGSADERALSPAGFAVRKRLPWLHINLVTAFLAAAVVGLFESIIAQFTALAVLLPVVAGQSGNAGAQALAVTMRGLALREIGLREWKQVLNKEVRVGLVDGLALAVTCGAGVYLWSQSFGLALVIGVAMVLSMLAAGIAGAVVPILLIRAGQDPATASSIILTTVTDVAGFFSFLGTATLLSFLL